MLILQNIFQFSAEICWHTGRNYFNIVSVSVEGWVRVRVSVRVRVRFMVRVISSALPSIHLELELC